MFWNDFSATLLAFILVIAVGERSVHAGKTFHAGTSGEGSQANPLDISNDDFDKELVVDLPLVSDDKRCHGVLTQLTDSDGHLFIGIVTQWQCWNMMKPGVTQASTGGGTQVSFETPPTTFKIGKLTQQKQALEIAHFAVFKVISGNIQRAVPLAKPNMLVDGVVGVTASIQYNPKVFSVVNGRYCHVDQPTGGMFCASIPNEYVQFVNMALGAPFFIKSSGQLYLAGLYLQIDKQDRKNGYLGGHVFTAVNGVILMH